jgi:transcriptional regulator with XRE-family HTH domain
MKEKEIKTYSGKIIYDALQKASYDVEKLAGKLNLTSVAIYQWFSGKNTISFKNVQPICVALDIKESELIDAIKKDKANIYDAKAKAKPQARHLFRHDSH